MNQLVEIARRNDDSLIAHYEHSQELFPDDIPLIQEFVRTVRLRGEVSVNCSLQSLEKILVEGEYKNIFQLEVADEEIKRRYNKYGEFYGRLLKFVEEFDPERKIKYGALNLGTIGIPFAGFGGGTCCFFLRSSFIRQADQDGLLACLARYSLYYYTIRTLERHPSFADEISTYAGVPYLAFWKHYQKGLGPDKAAWKKLILNENDLIEVLIGAPIMAADILRVGISKELYETVVRLNSMKTAELKDDELQILRTFLHIKVICNAIGIEIEAI